MPFLFSGKFSDAAHDLGFLAGDFVKRLAEQCQPLEIEFNKVRTSFIKPS